MSGSVAGAEITTFFAPASRCFCAPSRSGEEPGRLEHDVHAEIAPRQRGGIALREHAHLLAGRAEDAVGELDVALERAERRVVAQEMRHRLRVAEVVQRDDLEVGAERVLRAEEVPPDAAESVDADANAHLSSVVVAPTVVAASLTAGLRELLELPQAAVHRRLRRGRIGAGRELAQRLGRMPEPELCGFTQRIRRGASRSSPARSRSTAAS